MKRLHHLGRKWENGIDLKWKMVEDLTSLKCMRYEVLGAVSIKLNCDADHGGSRCQWNIFRPNLYHTTRVVCGVAGGGDDWACLAH